MCYFEQKYCKYKLKIVQNKILSSLFFSLCFKILINNLASVCWLAEQASVSGPVLGFPQPILAVSLVSMRLDCSLLSTCLSGWYNYRTALFSQTL